MALYVGDRAPKMVPFTVSTGATDGTTVESVRLKIRQPDDVEVEWIPGGLTKTTTSVAFAVTLSADGAQLPISGKYVARVWLYDADDILLLDTDDLQAFSVFDSKLTWPT